MNDQINDKLSREVLHNNNIPATTIDGTRVNQTQNDSHELLELYRLTADGPQNALSHSP